MTDAAWMADVIAEAEPIEERPQVRAIWFDTYTDALRVCRIFGAPDSDGKPVFAAIQKMSRRDARFFTGIARKNAIVITYTGGFWRDGDGERHARLYLYIGSEKELRWMQSEAEEILKEYQQTLAALGEYPDNNPYN